MREVTELGIVEGIIIPSEEVEKNVKLEPRAPSPGVQDEDTSHYLVEFEGLDDLDNPKNWSRARRWRITLAMGGMAFVVTFSSSVFVSNLSTRSITKTDTSSQAVVILPVAAQYHIGVVTSTLGVSLFLLVRTVTCAPNTA